MNIRPRIQFYKTIFPFILAFAFLGIIGFGIFYGFIFFVTFGLCFGFLGFQSIYKSQWYTYQNLGLTKWDLFKSAFLINLILGLPLFIILYLLTSFIFGDFSLT